MNVNIIIFSGYYIPGFLGGGPIRTVANMIDSIGDDFKIKVIARDRDLGESVAYSSLDLKKWNSQGKADVFYVPIGLGGIRQIIRILRDEKFNAISLNSFFSFQFSIIPILLSKLILHDFPIILGPRGEFSKGALKIKKSKKRFFLLFSRCVGLHKHIIWHASSDYEAMDIRRVMGPNVTIRVAMDIAKLGDVVVTVPREVNGPLRIVFISRISPMKNLIGAIKMLRGCKQEVVFDVYGPAEDESYWAECRSAASLLPDNVNFRYCGVLQPNDVVAKFAQYDLFLFPTLGENFGHVIAEALSAGLPVLISDTTPWRDLANKSIGWDLPLDQPDQFLACIEACCNKPAEEYDNWRKNIRAWAVDNIGNKEAIKQNRQLFMNLD